MTEASIHERLEAAAAARGVFNGTPVDAAVSELLEAGDEEAFGDFVLGLDLDGARFAAHVLFKKLVADPEV